MIFELPGNKENTHTMLELNDLNDEDNVYMRYIQPNVPNQPMYMNMAEI